MFSVSGRMSTNTGLAPKRTNALAVETKVNEGTITSSPGPRSQSMAAISRAAVQEGVSRTLWMPNRSSSSREHCLVKWPSPADIAQRDRLGDVVQLLAGDKRLVEGDFHGRLDRFRGRWPGSRGGTRCDARSTFKTPRPGPNIIIDSETYRRR